MILSGHQPVYLPGRILFNKMALSDNFMFTGHCQYSPKSWQTRNNIRTGMLSVPVHKHLGQAINATQFVNDHWKRKHLRSIEMAYQKRPYFNDYFMLLSLTINRDWVSLGAMNIGLIILLAEWFGIKTEISISEQYDITGHKTDMLIDMCKKTGADEYLSNEGARAYVDEVAMKREGITHRWQKFTHPTYDQGQKEFVPNLSAIDLLFNCRPDSGRIIREAGYAD